ncbi:MAG: metallophosphoesterase [Candidatus Zixiibacteriota bacterium]|nr:MAG: metallophosphoesterase [candidate division Zixibacteria bacterium]
MKILQTSNFYLGRYFEDNFAAGNKLRAGMKTIFSSVVDLAKEEKADLVIFAGDIFDNLDLSQNLLDFFASEVARLENIPAVLFPGNGDHYEHGSFWDYWKVAPPSENLYLLAGKRPVRIDIPSLSLTVYGIPIGPGQTEEGQLEFLKKSSSSKYHIALTNGAYSVGADNVTGNVLDLKPFESFGFNYVAVCGNDNFKEYDNSAVKAASSGSPLDLSPERAESGGVLLINMGDESVSTELRKVQSFEWRTVDISMETIHNLEDLKTRILEFSGQNTLLKVELSGLTLLEAGLNTEQLQSELEDHFLDLQFEDKTRVLPQNISEVKVQEKTVLGQYLKVMVGRLNEASESEREKYERSLKIGYSLLSGREAW